MTKRLTRKSIAAAVVERNSHIVQCELVRDPSGYFYAVGKYLHSTGSGTRTEKDFVTSGIYQYRLEGWSLEEWAEEVEQAIQSSSSFH